MRLTISLLITIILYSSHSHAITPPDVTDLISSASQYYEDGNYEIAISLYKKAESLGSPKAMLQLSSIYKSGKAVVKDEKIANEYLHRATIIYEKLANNGDTEAQFNLGRIYNYFIKPPQKLKAYNWLLIAAKNNHAKAQYVVASILDNGLLEPDVKRNSKEAVKWYEKAAEQGDTGAAYQLTYKHQGDFDSVIKWCMPAAKQQDNIWSSKCLKAINVTVSRNIYSKEYRQKSIDAIHELANSNIVMSQVTLARMYEEGTVIPGNLKEAKSWSNKAFNTALSKAKEGDKQAQYELSLLYEKGIGTDIYIDQAKIWLIKSAKQGYKPAIKKLATLN